MTKEPARRVEWVAIPAYGEAGVIGLANIKEARAVAANEWKYETWHDDIPIALIERWIYANGLIVRHEEYWPGSPITVTR